jgi:hypothetical protein
MIGKLVEDRLCGGLFVLGGVPVGVGGIMGIVPGTERWYCARHSRERVGLAKSSVDIPGTNRSRCTRYTHKQPNTPHTTLLHLHPLIINRLMINLLILLRSKQMRVLTLDFNPRVPRKLFTQLRRIQYFNNRI